MALAAESVFIASVAAAESTRQTTKAVAAVAYGFVAANLATYVAAQLAADVAYTTAVNSARTTSALNLGTVGSVGPIPTVFASLTGML
jgi:hypothetical protein